MHPMLNEMLMQPVGWLTIATGLIILGLPLWIYLFTRRKMKQEDRDKSDGK